MRTRGWDDAAQTEWVGDVERRLREVTARIDPELIQLSIGTETLEVPMGLFDEVRCNHELFGVHKGEKHQTKDLHWLGGALEEYEITPSGRLEFMEYTVEDRSDPTLEGFERFNGMMTRVFTGGRRDQNYHGWLYLSGFGRAKFTDGVLVAFEPEQSQPNESDDLDDVGEGVEGGEESGVPECNSASESTMEMVRRSELAAIARKFRDREMLSWGELDAFVDWVSPAVRSRLAWRLNRSFGLDANAIRRLLEDKSIEDGVAEEWLQFEQEPSD
jgi:hypothetical protein